MRVGSPSVNVIGAEISGGLALPFSVNPYAVEAKSR